MNNKTKTILGLVAFALILFAAVFAYNALSKTVKPGGGLSSTEEQGKLPGSSQKPDGTPAPAVSESPAPEKLLAPDFTVLDKDGNEVQLSDLMGKPMVLNFWAS
ncbi:MAG: redoxin domain-containing protein, partial [Oscillospiraceae bacterium]